MKDTLFDMGPASVELLDVLPVSVLDIDKNTQRRETGGHDAKSSRSEYSSFPREVSSLCYSFFLRDCFDIFDPFAGWGERHSAALKAGKGYIGFDINPEAIKRAQETYGVSNWLADSRTSPIPYFNGLLTCPPYWNLEKYAPDGLDACDTWASFIDDYNIVWIRCIAAAASGTVFCVMVGDWRSDGVYYNLSYETERIFLENGCEIVDKVIVSRRNITKIKVMLPQAKRLGYTVKVHEYLLVLKKTDDK